MSFWRTFGFHTVSAVENILARDSYTLEELLDEEEILQEVKSQNKKLLDFLTIPTTLHKLFEYITLEPSEDADPKRRFKYPYLASEILCLEIWTTTESIFKDDTLLQLLFNFLDHPPPLNSLLASYTSRVAQSLLTRRPAATLAYIKSRTGIVSRFIVHSTNTSVMELLLKIIATDDSPEGAGTVQWLCTTELVPSLVAKFDPEFDEDVHESAGQTLSDIITLSSQQTNPSPLLEQLESQDSVNRLFGFIFSGSNSVLLNGLSVVIELLRRHAHPLTDDTAPESLPPLLQSCLGKLEQFDAFLRTPVSTNMITTVGELNPLGFYRLKVVDFYLALIRTRYRSVNQQFARQGSLKLVLDLFFGYRWNNFLHAIVEQLVLTILDGQDDDIKYDLLVTSGLLDRIVEANKAAYAVDEYVPSLLSTDATPAAHPSSSTAFASRPRNARQGYLGFVTNIALAISGLTTPPSKIADVIQNHSEWQQYYNTTLTEIRTTMTKPLGGHRPMPMPTNNAHFLHGISGETSGVEEEEVQESHSIFDQYKLGFSDEFPDDGNDDYDETFDTHSGFARAEYGGHEDKNYEYDEEPVDDVNSDDSDEQEVEWTERKIADVGMGSSPTDDVTNSDFHAVGEDGDDEGLHHRHPHEDEQANHVGEDEQISGGGGVVVDGPNSDDFGEFVTGSETSLQES